MRKEKLRATFERMASSRYQGIPGVVRIAGKEPGPTVGITVMTHGNEPAGLALIAYLLGDVFDIHRKLARGTLYLVLNNIKAGRAYFRAKPDDALAERRARFVDLNMNRLPAGTRTRDTVDTYEQKRLKELLPIFRQFQYALDVHSMTSTKRPLIIARNGEMYPELLAGFPIRTILTDIDVVQIGKPIFSFFGSSRRKTASVFAIEAGLHFSEKTFIRATHCAVAFLRNVGMLTDFRAIRKGRTRRYDEYRITDSVMLPDETYDFVKNFQSFEAIRKGEPLARGAGGVIRAPFTGTIVFPQRRGTKVRNLKEEQAFLSRPKRIRRLRMNR